MSDDLRTLERELLAEIAGANNLAALDGVRVSALGKKGRVSELMSKLGSLPAEERKTFGQVRTVLRVAATPRAHFSNQGIELVSCRQ